MSSPLRQDRPFILFSTEQKPMAQWGEGDLAQGQCVQRRQSWALASQVSASPSAALLLSLQTSLLPLAGLVHCYPSLRWAELAGKDGLEAFIFGLECSPSLLWAVGLFLLCWENLAFFWGRLARDARRGERVMCLLAMVWVPSLFLLACLPSTWLPLSPIYIFAF